MGINAQKLFKSGTSTSTGLRTSRARRRAEFTMHRSSNCGKSKAILKSQRKLFMQTRRYSSDTTQPTGYLLEEI